MQVVAALAVIIFFRKSITELIQFLSLATRGRIYGHVENLNNILKKYSHIKGKKEKDVNKELWLYSGKGKVKKRLSEGFCLLLVHSKSSCMASAAVLSRCKIYWKCLLLTQAGL